MFIIGHSCNFFGATYLISTTFIARFPFPFTQSIHTVVSISILSSYGIRKQSIREPAASEKESGIIGSNTLGPYGSR